MPLLAGCGSHFELKRIAPEQTIKGSVVGPDQRRLDRVVGVAIDFLTPARGFMATRGGDLRRTADGGRTWTVVARGPKLASLSFVSASEGFALTTRGRVVATRNGGRSWRLLHSFVGHPDGGPFRGAIQFVDRERGWASAFGDRVYRTVDGGTSWSPMAFQCGFGLGGFSFVDQSKGFLICGGQGATIEQEKDLYVTAHGGQTWRRRACVHVFGPKCRGNLSLGGYASWLDFRDAQTGLLVSDRAGIALTLDGGRRWAGTLFTDDLYPIASTSWARCGPCTR